MRNNCERKICWRDILNIEEKKQNGQWRAGVACKCRFRRWNTNQWKIFSFQLDHGDSNSFSVVRNEPELADRDTNPSISKNVTIITTVEETDHSIGTPFVIAVWILSASIAKIGKSQKLCVCIFPLLLLFVFVLQFVCTELYAVRWFCVCNRLIFVMMDC